MKMRFKTLRQAYRDDSNNKVNPNKNLCVLACARALGTDHYVRYLHTLDDLIRAIRMRRNLKVRSRTYQFTRRTMGEARKKGLFTKTTNKMANPEYVIGYLMAVKGHVFIVGPHGDTLVDTDPRQRDRRVIWNCYVIYLNY